MAGFCTNCGNQVPDGTKFCPNCGSQIPVAASNNAAPNQGQPQMVDYQVGQSRKKKGGKGIFVLIAILVVVAIVAVILIRSLLGGGSGYKAAVKNAEKFFNDPTFENFETVLPEDMKELYSLDDEDIFEMQFESLMEMDEIDLKLEIKDAERLDSDDLAETLVDDYYADEDIAEEVTDAYELKVSYEGSVSYDGDEEDFKGRGDWLVVEYDGEWYTAIYDLDDFEDAVGSLYYGY